jgi:hypothetical protein
MSRDLATATLTYDAAAELLSGVIGANHFHMRAFSGGSRGHSAVSPALADKYLHSEATRLKSRFSNTPEIDEHGQYKQRGGTLPAGHTPAVTISTIPSSVSASSCFGVATPSRSSHHFRRFRSHISGMTTSSSMAAAQREVMVASFLKITLND